MNYEKVVGGVITFSIVSTLVVSLILINYVILNDKVLIPIYNTAQDLTSQSLVDSTYTSKATDIFNLFSQLPTILDFIWLISFIGLVGSVWVSAYFSKREGIFSVLGFLTWGIIFALFIISLYTLVSDYFYETFVTKLIPAVTVLTPFFSYYMSHIAIINLIIIVVAIILNVVNFDIKGFKMKKDNEMNEVI